MTLLITAAGFLVGVAAGVFAFVGLLKRAMIKASRSRFSFDETERRLREGPAPGWGFPIPEMNLIETLAKKGFSAPGIARAKVFFLCNPGYASAVIGAEHRMMGMLPCHWALYETASGEVFLSRLNIPLMSRVFSGAVGRAMSQVARDEKAMVPRIVGGEAATGGTGAASAA